MDKNYQTLLIVEDDEDLRNGLLFTFRQEGYNVCSASNLENAREILRKEPVDLIILDVMLPDGSGFDFCRELREAGDPKLKLKYCDLPVLFLSARDDEVDVIQGLELGGDDYITKPFRLRELVSRVKVRLRRQSSSGIDKNSDSKAGIITGVNGLRIDTRRAAVTKSGRTITLTASEYRLLLALVENKGQVLSRDQLADRLLGINDAVVDDNTVSVYIRRIREKIEEDPSYPRIIVTVRGMGYRYGESVDF